MSENGNVSIPSTGIVVFPQKLMKSGEPQKPILQVCFHPVYRDCRFSTSFPEPCWLVADSTDRRFPSRLPGLSFFHPNIWLPYQVQPPPYPHILQSCNRCPPPVGVPTILRQTPMAPKTPRSSRFWPSKGPQTASYPPYLGVSASSSATISKPPPTPPDRRVLIPPAFPPFPPAPPAQTSPRSAPGSGRTDSKTAPDRSVVG